MWRVHEEVRRYEHPSSEVQLTRQGLSSHLTYEAVPFFAHGLQNIKMIRTIRRTLLQHSVHKTVRERCKLRGLNCLSRGPNVVQQLVDTCQGPPSELEVR